MSTKLKTFEQRLDEAERQLVARGESLSSVLAGVKPKSTANVSRTWFSLEEKVEAAEARLAACSSGSLNVAPTFKPVAPVPQTAMPKAAPVVKRNAFEIAAAEKDPLKRALLFAKASRQVFSETPATTFEQAAAEKDPVKRARLFAEASGAL